MERFYVYDEVTKQYAGTLVLTNQPANSTKKEPNGDDGRPLVNPIWDITQEKWFEGDVQRSISELTESLVPFKSGQRTFNDTITESISMLAGQVAQLTEVVGTLTATDAKKEG